MTRPLQTERFKAAVRLYFEKARGHPMYQRWVADHDEKTDPEDAAGYRRWWRQSMQYLLGNYRLRGNRLLDIGCGCGEFVVAMSMDGYCAVGADVDGAELEVARALSHENNGAGFFVLIDGNTLPFKSGSFDVVTLFSVVEHMEDATLERMLFEVRRVCRGVVYILVPSKFLPSDPHTNLRGVPFLPTRIAQRYVHWKLRSAGKPYPLSQDGQWDVHFRTISSIRQIASRCGFAVKTLPLELVFPPLSRARYVKRLGFVWKYRLPLFWIPIPAQLLMRLGLSRLHFEPYPNLILTKVHDPRPTTEPE